MKYFLSFILSIIFSGSFAQDDPLKQAKKMIEERKYESAINILNAADPQNENPDIVIAKTDLFLEYFVTSIMHQLFALKDLNPDEELLEIRGSEGNFAMYQFSPDSAILRLLKQYPENYMLNKTLGNYYHDVLLKYGNNWLTPDSLVINNFYTHYKIAWDHDVFDHWSAYGLGYASLTKGQMDDAIIYLNKSTILKNSYPPSHYNLAYAYLNTNQREKSIESAKRAMELYEEPGYKADAARMIAITYGELKKNEEALKYYLQANEIDPNNYNTLKPLLETEIVLETENINMRTNEFFQLAPGNPTIYQDLMKMYWEVNKPTNLIQFLNSKLGDFKSDDKVTGNLYFYIAKIQYDQEDFNNAQENFIKSKTIFGKVFEPDHSVFQAIESYLNDI